VEVLNGESGTNPVECSHSSSNATVGYNRAALQAGAALATNATTNITAQANPTMLQLKRLHPIKHIRHNAPQNRKPSNPHNQSRHRQNHSVSRNQ
jgi:hypothetical protein